MNENCVVSVLNRNVQVNHDGTWILPNIPANFGRIRARATCVENGVTSFGESAYFTVPANGSVTLPPIVLGSTTSIPTSLTLSAPNTALNTAGATVQLGVVATYPNGQSADVTASNAGTNYSVSNAAIATISPEGLVTALRSGTVMVQATNEGTQAIRSISIAFGSDSDGDGIPDDAEIALGLNPNNSADGLLDLDHDGLTNLQEFQAGTQIWNSDTDGDTIPDGEEMVAGADGFITNPLLADTDGDGVRDALEITTGSDPTNRTSRNLAQALNQITVTPSSFVITVNSVVGEASQQLAVTGLLKDGTSLDLTPTLQSTNYVSSNLNICSFGSPDGRVFGGSNGSCTITVTNSGFSGQAAGTVRSFAPAPLSFVAIPGFANNVDVSGDFAYVAAGATGLQVVNVGNRTAPAVVAARETPGNANDVSVVGNLAYVADGSAGLQIIDITNPLAPTTVGAIDTAGDAWDVVVRGNLAYVADGASGLRIINVANPAAPQLLGSFDPPGTQKGVDIDPVRQIAVLASGSSGIHVVDISNPSNPVLLGSAITGDARDVVLKGDFAFVADYSRSFTAVDITDPRNPIVRASTPSATGGLLQDVAVAGNFGLGADVFFVNGVPIIDISTPSSPVPRAILDFRNFRDDDGTGIAADGSYVYLTAGAGAAFTENGTVGNTRLYIGQYLAQEDRGGIAPTVRITGPAAGSTFVEGSRIPVTVDATDDVTVAAVNFVVNGQVVFTDTSFPYEFGVTAPLAGTSLTLGATAVDLGGNVGTAANVLVNVIPDPKTRATGTVVDRGNLPVVGASVTCLSLSALSGTGGQFSIPGVPTVQGDISCKATFVNTAGKTLSGNSAHVPPVLGGVTDVGQIRVVEGNVLILSDAATPGTTALVNALVAAGNTVTLRPPPEYTWDGTNPPLDGFNVVIHLNGATYATPLPVAAQNALVNFVANGGAFIGSQWNGYERVQNQQVNMNDLVLQLWPGRQNCTSCNVTYNVVPGQENHPMLVGIPSSFTFFADGNSDYAAVPFAVNPSTVLMQTTSPGPGVLVRQLGSGRVVNFSHAANYLQSGSAGITLQDPNIQRLYINAVAWASGGL